MPRDYRVYLEDIREGISKIRRYTSGLTKEKFAQDEKTVDAVVRNLEVIGEATRHIPDGVRSRYPAADWKKMAALRNVLIHEYFGVDVDIVWDIVQSKLPLLETEVLKILSA